MKKSGRKTSSLLAKYSLMYEKKPRSRVFAPLAETYRKLGMLDEAFKILKEGIRYNPTYTLGYVVLSQCYYDLGNYELAYNTARPLIANNIENITLQKLFAKTCVHLGYLEEALQSFKTLLLINPKDEYVAEQIKLLEDDLLVNDDEMTSTEEYIQAFDEDEWTQVDFSQNRREEEESSDDHIAKWKVKASPLEKFKQEIDSDSISVSERKLDDDYFYEEFDHESGSGEDESEVIIEDKDAPFITHTLVDLYCSQGHYDRAKSVLENILELHPDDQASQNRLDEINKLISGETIDNEDLTDGRVARLEQILNEYKNVLVQRSNSKQ